MTIEQLFESQRKNSWNLRTAPLHERVEGLKKLSLWIESHQDQICQAMSEDFGKPEMEVLMTEIYPVLQEIHYAMKNLKKWARPQKVSPPLLLVGTKNAIYYEPKGVVLIIAPWNYPFNLAMIPVVAALAAGNCVILKPSELTPKTSQLMEDMLSSIFAPNHVLVAQGDKDISTKLLSLPFDHIFFTGSTQVGKIVMKAASEHLSDVTLELGGKSPAIIDSSADLDWTAQKIAWGKFVNAGQTCLAPDYLFVDSEIYGVFMEKLKHQLEVLYKDPAKDLARVISSRHLQRLSSLFNEALSAGAKLVYGGQFDFQKNTLSPTVIDQVPVTTQVMLEEIFGPLLPVLKFNNLNETIEFVNARPKPLSFYIFSKNKANVDRLLAATTAGGVCVNDSVIHFANHNLPFGGVGESGLGNYHGHYGFKTFSHSKSVLKQSALGRLLNLIYPPYTPWKIKLAKFLIRWKI
ncbi:aldehyde dehydrogenase family protein [Bdellovibrio sp. HCB337]|uniref:aldehyde dehydrogenase family protein n=1 Tax=Bdellovibrio sp. HCB337 TaxID=3394358 RepID=UPI0039A59C16